jgi:hypothetical protein
MKGTLTSAAVALGILLSSCGREAVKSEQSDQSDLSLPQLQPPTQTLSDATEIFKRAFWRRPTAEDKILHAERREWTDDDGLEKWQWFLAVEPSTALLNYLRKDNPFSLVPLGTAPEIEDAPAWFTFQGDEVDSLHAPHGRMLLIFSKTNYLLLATDSGGGFYPGAQEPMEQTPVIQSSSGRFPSMPPPHP